MNVICLQEEAFYELIERVVERLSDKHNVPANRWIDGKEALRMLGRAETATTTLQRLRDEGKIRYSQPSKKVIMYDRESIDEYLDVNAKETF